MSTNAERGLRKLAVIGAGNMGSGIAQKMATEGFSVTLVDLDDEKVERGLSSIRRTLAEGVERKIFRSADAEKIEGRVRGTTDWNDLADTDLVVEAVFEDLVVKRQVFERLEAACRDDTILGTNTSSFSVTELAEGARHPGRIIGLHYFYHPAKNRLVEVVPGNATDDAVTDMAWKLQEQLGKTPIASADAAGFVVNRYFVPWLNEAVRLLEEGVAEIPTIEWAGKKTFGVGMGPFELMNVTGVPIAMHAATTLGRVFGPFYAPADALVCQVEAGKSWEIEGTPDESRLGAVADRMLAAVFHVAGALIDEGVGTVEDVDIGARVGLRWPRGPFQLINRRGVRDAAALAAEIAGRWELPRAESLARRAASGEPFPFRLVKSETKDGVATLTINRPDAMNALNEAVVAQLHAAFRAAADDPAVSAIVIGGAGKAFIAGADIRFFVRNIDAGNLDRIVAFTKAGHALLGDIASCPKPTVARLDGLALGGGLELALACHRIVATPKATLAFPETGIGIYPGLGGTQRLPWRVGPGLAKWLIFTGQMLTADEACEIGLVDRVVPYGELDAGLAAAIAGGRKPTERPELGERHRALEALFTDHSAEDFLAGRVETRGDEKLGKLVKRVGFKAPIALRLAGRLVDESTGLDLEQGLQRELDHLVEIFKTEDAYEGLSTLGRKRPEFKDR